MKSPPWGFRKLFSPGHAFFVCLWSASTDKHVLRECERECVWICAYVHVHVRMHVRVRVHVRVHVRAHVRVRVRVCLCVFVCMCEHAFSRVGVCIYMRVHARVLVVGGCETQHNQIIFRFGNIPLWQTNWMVKIFEICIRNVLTSSSPDYQGTKRLCQFSC